MPGNVAEVIGKSDVDFYPREQVKKFLRDDRRILRGEIAIIDDYEKNRGRYVHVIKVPVKDYRDNIVGVLGIFLLDKFKRLGKIRKLISFYAPRVLVIQDYAAKPARRAERIQQLGTQMESLAAQCGLSIKQMPFSKVQRVFFGRGNGTKHEIAQALAMRFPEELGPLLPPKRKLWMPQHPRMDMFDAIALAIAHAHKANASIGIIR